MKWTIVLFCPNFSVFCSRLTGIISLNLDMWHDIQQGHAAWMCSMDIQRVHAAYACYTDMQHESTASACSMYMLHGHAVWRSSRMQLVHAELRFNMFIVFLNKYVQYYIARDYARHGPPLVGSVLQKIAMHFINQTQLLHYYR
jgi:hypothetical protein